jgi:2'-5' RNA ligase
MSDTAQEGLARIRVFVAVALPAPIRRELFQLRESLEDGPTRKAVKWVREQNLHLTLRFIGAVRAEEISALGTSLQEAVRGVSSFPLGLEAGGCFPNVLSPKVLWIGLGGDLDRLAELQCGVERETGRWGEREERAFHPHITLGRVATRDRKALRALGSWVNQLPVPTHDSWEVNSIELMQSVLNRGGSSYSSLACFALGSGPSW